MMSGVIGNTKIIGLDLSTKCSGYSIFEGNKLKSHGTIDLSKNKDMDQRTRQMMVAVGKLIKKESPDYVIIEDSFSKGNVQVTKDLAYIIGAAIYQSELSKAVSEKVLPSQWRSKIGILQSKKKRPELKQEAIDMVRERYGFDPIEDEAEAILIGLSKTYQDTSELFE